MRILSVLLFLSALSAVLAQYEAGPSGPILSPDEIPPMGMEGPIPNGVPMGPYDTFAEDEILTDTQQAAESLVNNLHPDTLHAINQHAQQQAHQFATQAAINSFETDGVGFGSGFGAGFGKCYT